MEIKSIRKITTADLNTLSDDYTAKAIRQLRRLECFDVADRAAWYDALTDEQKAEVQAWRKAWLDAPETGIIPKKPDWIK